MIRLAFRILLAWSVLLGALAMAGLAEPPRGLAAFQEIAP